MGSALTRLSFLYLRDPVAVFKRAVLAESSIRNHD